MRATSIFITMLVPLICRIWFRLIDSWCYWCSDVQAFRPQASERTVASLSASKFELGVTSLVSRGNPHQHPCDTGLCSFEGFSRHTNQEVPRSVDLDGLDAVSRRRVSAWEPRPQAQMMIM
jgi:hypothetical protein